MSKSASILFVGDVVGGLGKRTLLGLLPSLKARLRYDFLVVNGENAAGGLGITPKIADQLFAGGVDVITLGNHTYRQREIYPYLDAQDRILRPANYLRSQPGHGVCVVRARRGPPRGGVAVGKPVSGCRAPRVPGGRHGARESRGPRRSRAGRHARGGDEREGRARVVPRRAGDRGGRHPHARAHRGCARAAGRHRLHHRRRHDRPARRRDRRQARAGDRGDADQDARPL